MTFFIVNLTNVYRTALLELEYNHLPTLGMLFGFPLFALTTYFGHIASGEHPSMGAIAAPFLMSRPMEDGLYFEGFCGEHQYEYPGIVQLAGAVNEAIIGMCILFDD